MKSLAFIFALLFSFSAVAKEQLVSEAVARIRAEVLTTRDVEINAVAEQVLFSQTAIAKIKKSKKNSPQYTKDVSNLILEWVTYYESKLFPVIKVSPAEKRKALSLLKSAKKTSSYWRSLEVKNQEIETLLQRKLLSKKFINFKAESSNVPITEEEAKDYFEKNKTKFGELPFENFSKDIKRHLAQEQKKKRLKDWFEILHAKYKVKRFSN